MRFLENIQIYSRFVCDRPHCVRVVCMLCGCYVLVVYLLCAYQYLLVCEKGRPKERYVKSAAAAGKIGLRALQ